VLRIAVLVLLLCLAAPAQVAILQIQVMEGEAAILQPGVRSSRALTVEITDETGKPVAGAAVSFHLPDDGPGGAFASGLRTDVVVTDGRGRATVHAFQANRTSGRFQIRIVASKEQARAGTVAFQYIAELKPGATAVKSGRRGRWILVGLAAVGGGAAAALAASHGGSAAVATPAPTAPAFSIGAPNISVGKP
jgi:hypothetical protein